MAASVMTELMTGKMGSIFPAAGLIIMCIFLNFLSEMFFMPIPFKGPDTLPDIPNPGIGDLTRRH
jgi:hypothetical protein